MSAYLSDQQLDDVVRRYQDMVYRIAMLRMKNRTDADDVFQEVFVRLVRNAAKLESEEHLKAWLIRVTINCCNSLHTETFRKRTVSYDDLLEKDSGDADYGRDPGGGEAPFAEDRYGVENEDILSAVQRLPGAYRDVIYLFYYEDLPVRKIAEILQTSEGAVKTRLSRARDMLKDRLKDVEK